MLSTCQSRRAGRLKLAGPCEHGTVGIKPDLQLLQAFRQTALDAH
jgi:hypothetical protein